MSVPAISAFDTNDGRDIRYLYARPTRQRWAATSYGGYNRDRNGPSGPGQNPNGTITPQARLVAERRGSFLINRSRVTPEHYLTDAVTIVPLR